MRVYGELKKAQVENIASGSVTSPAKGMLIYDGTTFKIYTGGTWVSVDASGGTTGTPVIWTPGEPAAQENIEYNIEFMDFDEDGGQNMLTRFTVPESYAAGAPIKLTRGLVAVNATTGNVLIKAIAYLVRTGTTAYDAVTLSHTSINAQLTISGSANIVRAIGDIDLTDTDGTIGGTAVAIGDLIIVKLYRASDLETTPVSAQARVVKDSFIPEFA